MDGSNRFIGGAEKARRKARQKLKQPTKKQQNKKNKNTVSKKLKRVNPPERFFAALLLSSVDDLSRSNGYSGNGNSGNTNSDDHIHWCNVIGDICSRAGVPFPSPLQATCDTSSEFYNVRASLVLEESRAVLAEAIMQIRQKMYHNRNRNRSSYSHSGHYTSGSGAGIDVTLMSMIQKKNGFVSLTFGKKRQPYGYGTGGNAGGALLSSFSPSELYQFKPGNVLQVNFEFYYRYPNGHTQTTIQSILTSVAPSTTPDDRSVSLTAYRSDELYQYMNHVNAPGVEYSINVIPIATLISEQRQFVACFLKPKVPFLLTLMGAKSATHTRFESSSDNDDEEGNSDAEEKKEEEGEGMGMGIATIPQCDDDHHKNNEIDRIPLSAVDIPILNASQEAAAIKFLNGPIQNLSLVQGPPGTGKTQFMTAILIRTFLKDFDYKKYKSDGSGGEGQSGYCTVLHDKRVLVSAPTNKAVTVIASRFLRAVNDFIGLNVVLIGVEDALFPTDTNTYGNDQGDGVLDANDDMIRPLRSIFLYTWVEELIKDFNILKLKPIWEITQQEIEDVLKCGEFLVSKMKSGIPHLSQKCGCIGLATQFMASVEDIQRRGISKVGVSDITDANKILSQLIFHLSEMQRVENPTIELLSTANIIFSTLSSSGTSLMKRTKKIDELFVDEAAAATEAEILIPLQLKPSRMLAVGDPKQLPATITSQRAVKLGLDKSLLDRLMFHCDQEHVMLDIQYRMRPDISCFPSKTFYGGRLENGSNVTCPSYVGKISILNSNPYTFIQINGEEKRSHSGSYYNMHEAQAVVQIVEQVRDAAGAATRRDDGDDNDWSSLEHLRIITFYAGQVKAIKDLLRHKGLGQVTVATVDSSQGSESDIVIVSFVRCEGRSGFLQDDRRINVALTRARYQLICVGDAEDTLMKSEVETLTGLAHDARQRNLLQSSDHLAQSVHPLPLDT